MNAARVSEARNLFSMFPALASSSTQSCETTSYATSNASVAPSSSSMVRTAALTRRNCVGSATPEASMPPSAATARGSLLSVASAAAARSARASSRCSGARGATRCAGGTPRSSAARSSRVVLARSDDTAASTFTVAAYRSARERNV